MEDGPSTGLTDEDAVPATPAEPVTKPGDLILLGSHRLLCGDATKAEDVARLLDGTRPHLMVTDPPYGVDYDPAWRNEAGSQRPAKHRQGRKRRPRRLAEAWALFPGDVAYVWHAGSTPPQWRESLSRVRLRYPGADHLVEEPLCARARRLPLAA